MDGRSGLKTIYLIIIVAVCAIGVGLAWYYSGGPLPAEFVVENLEISPDVVYPGEEVTISVDVTNVGGTAGSKLVKLEDGGEILGSETVALDPGEAKWVSFTVVVWELGSYAVRIGDLTGSFEVVPLPVAEFVVENLEISPDVVYPGEEVTISVDVTNIGGAAGTYAVKLEVGGEVASTENVTLGPSKTRTVSFTTSKYVVGEYSVRVDGLIGIFEVRAAEPVEFTVENLSISPETVGAGESVTISVDVANIGSTAGSKLVKLKIDGALTDSKSVTLDPGESKPVSFTVSKSVAGIYSVSIDNLAGSFEVVLSPVAEFVVVNLEISPGVVHPGDDVTISVDIANIGAAQGTHTIKLKVKGVVVDSKSVTLNPGDFEQVSFTVSRSDPSTYAVSVDGLAGSFTVVGGEMWSILTNYNAGGSLEVNHWWTIDMEELAFNVAKSGMKNQYPNVTFTPVPVPGGAGGNMPPKILPQLMAGKAPESFQVHPGYEVATYMGYLKSLNDLWAYDSLEQRTPEIIREMCKIGGNYYVVPIGVHQTNMIWYNKQLFESCGITPPSGPITFTQFWALCDELKNKLPPGKYPLDLGDGMGTSWAATQVFETIMAGLNLQTYEDFINGTVTAEQLKPVLEAFKKFLSYIPDDHLARNWAEVCGRLYTGRVAMYLHGDWAKGYFINRGWQYGVQYGSFPAPGTSGLFGLCVDGFVVPEKAGNIGNGLRWVHSYTTGDVQTAFNPVKGSVSPYNDIPLGIYGDDYSKQSAQRLQDPSTKFYPTITHGIAIPNDVLFSLHPKISEFVLIQDVETSAQEIADVVKGGSYTISWDIAP